MNDLLLGNGLLKGKLHTAEGELRKACESKMKSAPREILKINKRMDCGRELNLGYTLGLNKKHTVIDGFCIF